MGGGMIPSIGDFIRLFIRPDLVSVVTRVENQPIGYKVFYINKHLGTREFYCYDDEIKEIIK
jgi:hypothetical protein